MSFNLEGSVKIFKAKYPSVTPSVYSYAPGRINFIGEHVDYIGGGVVPASISQGSHVVLGVTDTESDEWNFEFHSQDLKQNVNVTFNTKSAKNKGFATLCAGAAIEAWKLAGAPSTPPRSVKGIVQSNVPLGSGLSSSAAVSVSIINALVQLFNPAKAPVRRGDHGLTQEFVEYRRNLVRAARAVENVHFGVNVGTMDQYASIHGEVNSVMKVDCGALTHERVNLPDPTKTPFGIILFNSMRAHSLGDQYNKIRYDMEMAENKITAYLDKAGVKLPRSDRGVIPIKALVGKTFESNNLSAPAFIKSLLDKGVLTKGEYDRSSFAVEEMERTNTFAAATKNPVLIEDPPKLLATLGALINTTHAGLRDKLGVSTEELDKIYDTANSSPGVYGCRVMGGGFGGCVITLYDKTKFTPQVQKKLCEDFKAAFPDLGECAAVPVAIGRGAYIQILGASEL